MAKTIYYYRVNSKGLPLIKSNNTAVGRIPKGRVVIYDPMFKACCDENITLPTSTVKKQRYFVKLDEKNHPISNSLIMRGFKPKGNWQEVFNKCCIVEPTEGESFVKYLDHSGGDSFEIIIQDGENIIIGSQEDLVDYLISIGYDASIDNEGNLIITFTEEPIYNTIALDVMYGEVQEVIILTLYDNPSDFPA